MNFEGQVKNTYPMNIVRPYNTNNRGSNIVLHSYAPDSSSLNKTLDKYLDKNTLAYIISTNPEINKILTDNGIPFKIDIESFKKNVYNHSLDSKNTAIGIYNNLPKAIQSQANIKDITEGALLHDLGKILIPEKILTKQKKLNPSEENIVQLHSLLSYELLKNQKNINNNVLKIIKYHHQTPAHTGYPLMAQTEQIDLNSQIVSMADKYSALREERSYKKSFSKQEALNILYEEMNKGVSPYVYNALSDYVNKTNSTKQITNNSYNYYGQKSTIPSKTERTVLYG